MYNSNGNYEAFARPKKPARADEIKNVYIVGSGLAGLAAAAFLVRDGQVEGSKIRVFEELPVGGGSLDGAFIKNKGWVVRGGREMENHYECLWDLYRSIPSLEIPDASVLDEYYWLNKEDPNFSMTRLIEARGQQKPDDGKYNLTDRDLKQLIKLILTKEEDLQDKKINEVFSDEFLQSNFWWYYKTMFAFENWASVMEMRRYLLRFCHHIDGLMDMSALKFTKYNQFESLVLPLITWLKSKGVVFQYDTQVKNILVDQKNPAAKKVTKIELVQGQKPETLEVGDDDLVFVTNGSATESSTTGDNNTPARETHKLGGSWSLWKNMAVQDALFGNPAKFCENIPSESWFIASSITINDKVLPWLEKISKREPIPGKVVTGGIVSVVDSNWEISYTMNRQPHFKNQKPGEYVVWLYGLLSNTVGNYIKKPIEKCTGIEITQEWLYHLGVPDEQIYQLASEECNNIPTYLPFITSYFMPRALGDRPKVNPEGYLNLCFIGNFAEIEHDVVFTTEYSVRTAMTGVYTLLGIDRGVPEVYASSYDVRELLKTLYWLTDKQKIKDLDLSFGQKVLTKKLLKKLNNTMIEDLLVKENLK